VQDASRRAENVGSEPSRDGGTIDEVLARLADSRRRRSQWLLVVAYVSAIFASIPYVPHLSRAVRGLLGPWVLGSAGAAFGLAAVAAAVALGRPRWRLRDGKSQAVVVCALCYAGMVWYLSGVPDEVVHLAEYGALSLLVWRALPRSRQSARLATLSAGVIGLIDEAIQGITPGRFFDVRDLLVNFIAAALPLWLFGKMSQNQPSRLKFQ
jgi:hypothetical protein